MEVRGPGSISGAVPIGRTAPAAAPPPAAPAAFVAPRDEVEISSAARMLDAASRSPGVREQRLEQIRAAIASGTYETPEKLESAVDRLLASLAAEEASGN
ncbi:MAG: flagellar biosynthesis anti-sigma factor FlgM [Planctomycetota bacterium]|nr:flagellar biosynthesis anti-sigma factor FlgM [Planctomycetota bacterium]